MDSLHITNLSVETKIGVHNWEQHINQKLLIDITIPYNFEGMEDNLKETVDYDAISQSVTQFVSSKSFQLIETVANAVAQLVKEEFKLDEITVAVSKPHALKNAQTVQVIVRR